MHPERSEKNFSLIQTTCTEGCTQTRVTTVLNTTKAERNTQQNGKDNQGLFAATSSFMLTQSSGNTFVALLLCCLMIA